MKNAFGSWEEKSPTLAGTFFRTTGQKQPIVPIYFQSRSQGLWADVFACFSCNKFNGLSRAGKKT